MPSDDKRCQARRGKAKIFAMSKRSVWCFLIFLTAKNVMDIKSIHILKPFPILYPIYITVVFQASVLRVDFVEIHIDLVLVLMDFC